MRRGGSARLSPGPGENPTCQSSAVVICGVSDSSPLTEPSELPARLCGIFHRQQEMPHDRHSVTAENEPLNVREVERGRIAIMPPCIKQPAKKPRACFAAEVCVLVSLTDASLLIDPGLRHGTHPCASSHRLWLAIIGEQRSNVLHREPRIRAENPMAG